MLAANGLADDIHLEEGSGISRGNRFTARGLAKVLDLFAPHADLLHGHDGGLNKTGTFSGVRTLAGYADTSKPRAGALRDRAQGQWPAALPAAQGHPGRALAPRIHRLAARSREGMSKSIRTGGAQSGRDPTAV